MLPKTSLPDTKKALSSKQMQAALMLANGSTIDATSQAVGVSEKSIDNWKKLSHFQEAVRAAEEGIYQDALKLLKRTARAGVGCLIGCMDPKVSNYVRVQAASKLLDKSIEIHTLDVLTQRLTALEQQLDALDARDAAKR